MDAIDDEAVAFYQAHGFRPEPTNARRLVR